MPRRFIERLQTSVGDTLSKGEIQALQDAVANIVTVAADQDIVRENERKTESSALLDGWACRYTGLADGRRQILSLHIPGDIVDLHSFELERMDHSIQTLTPCRLAIIPHEAIRRITELHPRLSRFLWRATLHDAVVMRQWMLGLGQRSALEHAAHLFCEMYHRLRAARLTSDGGFVFPLNQSELGDALGISPVHTNRVLQELRALGVLSMRGQNVEIHDLARLESLAQFDPSYLSLGQDRASGAKEASA